MGLPTFPPLLQEAAEHLVDAALVAAAVALPAKETVVKQRPKLLLINGLVLGAVASAQFVMDFAGYWYGVGPTGPTLHGNLDTIGFAEAHGLAAGFALLMILRRNDGWAGWHLAAALVHILLGTCNLIFWPIFEAAGLVPMGIVATAMHAVFAGLELRAYFAREGVRSVSAT